MAAITNKSGTILNICKRCKFEMWRRFASGSVRQHEKREKRKEEVIKYQSENAKPTERVYVFGYAATGALGVYSFLKPKKRQSPVVSQYRPSRLRFMDENNIEVHDVACGYGFTVFAAKRNRKEMVLATGINTDSQLGYHEYPRKSGRVLDYVIEPVDVRIPQLAGEDKTKGGVIQVACGRAHTVFLTQLGVFAQGNNSCGQCGHKPVEGEIFSKVSNIQKIEDLPENVVKVVCGQDHSMFLTADGQVYSCGLGADGQTGLETFHNVGNVQRVKGDIDGVKIVDIACRADCVLALSESGDVFGWGNSEYCQLSMVSDETQISVPRHLPITERITAVATGGSVCAMLDKNGQVYVWGFGIVGQGPKVDMLKSPSLLPPPLFGCNEMQPNVKVIQVKCGMSHFAAVTDVGDLYTWGKGKYGCLGIHDTEHQYFPLKVALPAFAHRVECGVDHTVVLARSFT